MQKTRSVKPKKQRKMYFQAPHHMRYKNLSAPLNHELRASYKVRTIPVRSGDTVRVTRGDRKGFEGKITRVSRENYKIHIEGLTREKTDGTTIFIPIHPSKVMVIRLNLNDKWRKKILERKSEANQKVEKLEETSNERIVKEKKGRIKEKKAKEMKIKKNTLKRVKKTRRQTKKSKASTKTKKKHAVKSKEEK